MRLNVTDRPASMKDRAQVLLSGPNGEVEAVWAVVVDDYFRIQDHPLYANGISRLDIIEATKVAPEHWNGLGAAGSAGVFQFVRVHNPSGIRSLRILFDIPLDSESRTDLLNQLETMQCDYGGNEHRLAVGIPASVNMEDVCAYFDASGLRWEYANLADQVE